MDSLLNKFKGVVKIRPCILDNEVFQLHYRVTFIMLLFCAGLVASKQHFGDPIDCITKDDVPNKLMDTYCWIHSTFTLPEACNKTVGLEIAHPCVDKFGQNPDKEERRYHKYYQWVYFVLFFQAIGFYMPHQIWKSWEQKLLRKLTVDLDLRNPVMSDDDRKKKVVSVAKYLTEEKRSLDRQEYFRWFTTCEVMNFVNVIMQIYTVDEFLGGAFTSYGLEVIDYASMDQENRVDPMVKVFPKMTKCTFHRFGSSGDVQRYDALCILPLNIVNEKIYIIMWFWFVFLAAVTGIWLVYRFLTHVKPDIKYRVLLRRIGLTDRDKLRYVLNHKSMKSGEWFLLSMVNKNTDSQTFRLLIEECTRVLKQIDQQRGEKNGLQRRIHDLDQEEEHIA